MDIVAHADGVEVTRLQITPETEAVVSLFTKDIAELSVTMESALGEGAVVLQRTETGAFVDVDITGIVEKGGAEALAQVLARVHYRQTGIIVSTKADEPKIMCDGRATDAELAFFAYAKAERGRRLEALDAAADNEFYGRRVRPPAAPAHLRRASADPDRRRRRTNDSLGQSEVYAPRGHIVRQRLTTSEHVCWLGHTPRALIDLTVRAEDPRAEISAQGGSLGQGEA